MVQGHLNDVVLSPEAKDGFFYQLQLLFHGSTAPGFLFASGFVAGLPRAPLSLRATLRRARRLVFILGVGYALHLPHPSLWKTLAEATPADKAHALSCNALHVIAVTQLFVLALQWIAGRRWTVVAGAMTLLVLAATPAVWSSEISRRLPLPLGAYLDAQAAPSAFPVFPYSAFVLAGTVAGAALGRKDERTRARRAVRWGGGLLAAGGVLSLALRGRVDFWHTSPGYALMRLGALLLLLLAVERLSRRGGRLVSALALIGHETLLVYVLHLQLLYGSALWPSPVPSWAGRFGLAAADTVLLATMVLVLYAAAWAWHRLKVRWPQAAQTVLSFLTVAFLWEFLTRPW
jgi:Heparan-alpha-glucosaminide N-acetyltransferase, catalytic